MLIVLVIVTVINTLVAASFSLAAVFFPALIVRDGEGSHTARVFALYGAVRSVLLLLVVLWAAFRADGPALIWLGMLAGIIQLADAAIGTQTRDKLKIWVPLVLGAAQMLAVGLAYTFG